ncbi:MULTISPECIES: antibiotic biosynthesis monooxygenase family protein [Pseudomonadaceae]|uniref:Antibiotic biosynthesis monooxygenase n=1 Tax=Pseudomonas denitrificans TaxID=43306 RepID=A0A9X7N3Q4_PSEDE|nr:MULTISPECIES: antibiotic biosynthesis monooxygenase family protein [Pseudomonadaceae]OQR32134.1 antibiotic biosynthesis monooxygenase [Pseudomonas sp. T]MBD9514927.1 antibiotic biosynthesis monooxygenase [Pseudomonas sp. PDM22]MBD9634266.1 antibiotic biosynthesis monooxygenase [Pseudomonas sp. PDM19]MBD9685785.1 antibiotic biosynthesis monooxygenase [Pseudomonas sp. PDM20]QEY74582.1 antibiotic biosynthesis monooxygenase [Pseudomonas denitrificans (nom. rej.)]
MHWQTPIEHELQIHPRLGHEAELGALIDNLVDGARRAPGCLRCQLVAGENGQPWLLQGSWKDEEALLDYFATPSLQLLGEVLLCHCRSLSGGIVETLDQATGKVA